MTTDQSIPSSFRDPSGFLFWRNGELYRQINTNYREDYDTLIGSRLYDALVNANLLIPFSTMTNNSSFRSMIKILPQIPVRQSL